MNILELTQKDLTDVLKQKYQKGDYHSKAIYRELIKNGKSHFRNAEEFLKSTKLAEVIAKELTLPLPEIKSTETKNGVTKIISRYSDNQDAESVIIPMKNHNTLCISSQIGCKMGCKFCETGNMGFIRNLSVSEIVSQVYTARFILKTKIKNLVFMGMGEPLDNFRNVLKAIDVLNDQRGFDFAHRHITVSTAGLVNGIRKLGELEYKNINLAISLNAPNDEVRSSLMPINKIFPMNTLLSALKNYPLKNRGSFFIEYVVIPGINNSKKHAMELTTFLKNLPVRVNLIPLNRTSAFQSRVASDAEINQFGSFLESQGLFVIKRWSRGSSLFAACGQLGPRMSS